MTHSVHLRIVYNKLSKTCCMSSQQANRRNSLLPVRQRRCRNAFWPCALGDGRAVPWHNWHYGYSVFVDVVGGRFILVFVYSKAVCQPISWLVCRTEELPCRHWQLQEWAWGRRNRRICSLVFSLSAWKSIIWFSVLDGFETGRWWSITGRFSISVLSPLLTCSRICHIAFLCWFATHIVH